MKDFLDKYASLSNKNNPILIYYGNKISEQIFNQRINKSKLDILINKIRNMDNVKINISYTRNVVEYKMDNHSVIKNGSELDYLIYEIQDTLISNKLYFVKYNIQNNTVIIPSIEKYEHIEKYDIMTININNILDIKVYDYLEYYTINVILKKPNSSSLLINLLEKIFI